MTFGVRSGFSWGYAHLVIYASIAAFGVGAQLAIEGSAQPEIAAAAGAAGEEFGAGARMILAGSVAVYLVSISFIHWVNRRSLENHVAFARLGVGAALILVAVFGWGLTPLALVGLVALAMVGLTAFEVWHSRIPGTAAEPTVPHQSEP